MDNKLDALDAHDPYIFIFIDIKLRTYMSSLWVAHECTLEEGRDGYTGNSGLN